MVLGSLAGQPGSCLGGPADLGDHSLILVGRPMMFVVNQCFSWATHGSIHLGSQRPWGQATGCLFLRSCCKPFLGHPDFLEESTTSGCPHLLNLCPLGPHLPNRSANILVPFTNHCRNAKYIVVETIAFAASSHQKREF